jgi:transglutaminase-like putative cysteine protease
VIEGFTPIPRLEITWQMIDEPDNLITPGDRVKFRITLENIGDVNANNLILSLYSPNPDIWIAKFEEGKMGGAHPESYKLHLDIYLGPLSTHTSTIIYIEIWVKVYMSQDRPWSPFPGLKEELYKRDYSWIDDLPVLGPHDIIITGTCNGVPSYEGKMTIDINYPDFSSFYTVQQLNNLKPFLQGSETCPDYPKADTFHLDSQLIKDVAAKAVAFSLLQFNATTYRLNGAADTPYQAIKNIYDWLSEYYAIGSDVQRWSDTEIVTNMMNKQFGDCSQISDLTISLCRSVKIPTRKLFGAEMKKVGPIWVFTFISSEAHEWAEAYVNDRWVQVDRALRLFDNPLGVYYEHSIMFVHLCIPGLLQGGPWYCKFSDCSAFNTGRITDFLISHKDHFGDAEDNPNNYIP